MYKIFFNQNDARPWYVAVAVTTMSGSVAFWQQISPNYVYEGNARRWAARNKKMLTEQ